MLKSTIMGYCLAVLILKEVSLYWAFIQGSTGMTPVSHCLSTGFPHQGEVKGSERFTVDWGMQADDAGVNIC
jgi:hypothetical protein